MVSGSFGLNVFQEIATSNSPASHCKPGNGERHPSLLSNYAFLFK